MSAGATTDDGRTMYCRRCDDAVRVVRPWHGWKAARNAWYVVMGLMVLLFPVMASDFCVMIPTLMLMILAGSPLHALAREKPVCTRCSLELDGGAHAGTGVRPRPRESGRQ
jgi:hypothetical protein